MKLLSALLFTLAAVMPVAADKIRPARALQTPVVMPVAPPSFVVPVAVPTATSPVGVPTTTTTGTKMAKKAATTTYRGYRLSDPSRRMQVRRIQAGSEINHE